MPQYNNVTLVGATKTKQNITTQSVIKSSLGTLFMVNVVTPGTSAGTIYDSATIGNAGTANEICNVGTASPTPINFGSGIPFQNGLVINPGTGQVLSVAFS